MDLLYNGSNGDSVPAPLPMPRLQLAGQQKSHVQRAHATANCLHSPEGTGNTRELRGVGTSWE